jgi:RNA polymerase sigma-70 factor (ECF subfamily)
MARIVSHFSEELSAVARAYERDPDRRKDLRQDMLVGLWQSLPHFQNRCPLGTWVRRVARDVAVAYRATTREDRLRTGVDLDEVDVASDVTEDVVARRQCIAFVRMAVERLGPMDRALMLLHLGGFDAPEIAAMKGCSRHVVYARLDRTTSGLRARLMKAGWTAV